MANGRDHKRHGGFGWRPSLPDPRDIVADPTEIPILPEVDPRGTYGYFLMPWSVLLDRTFSGDFRTIYRPLSTPGG